MLVYSAVLVSRNAPSTSWFGEIQRIPAGARIPDPFPLPDVNWQMNPGESSPLGSLETVTSHGSDRAGRWGERVDASNRNDIALTGTFPSAIVPLTSILAFALLPGCAPTDPDRPDRAERIAIELTSVQSALAECSQSDLPDLIHAAVERTLDLPKVPKPACFYLEDWAPLLAELQYFERWSPSQPGGDPALVKRRGEPVSIVKSYANALAERGVDLLVVPIPTRVQVYPDRLPGVPRFEEYCGYDVGYLQLMNDLLEAGIEVIDLLPPFFAQRYDDSGENDRLLYQDYDPHWTPRGAALCADLLAQRIRQFAWFEPGPYEEKVDFIVRREPELRKYRKTPEGRQPTATLWYQRVLDLDNQPAQATGDDTPLLILGDSFSMVFDEPQGGDLVRLLYARIGWRMDTILVKGGALNSTWQSLSRRSEGVQGRRLVLWIISGRALGATRMEQVDVFGDDH